MLEKGLHRYIGREMCKDILITTLVSLSSKLSLVFVLIFFSLVSSLDLEFLVILEQEKNNASVLPVFK